MKAYLRNKIYPYLVDVLVYLYSQFYSFKFHQLIIRKNTTDKDVFGGIFIGNELKLPRGFEPKLIIDAGAYTGFSTLYLNMHYPNAKIIAIEPELSNFNILKIHTKNLTNVSIVNSGLWSKETYLKIIDNNKGEWGFSVKEVENEQLSDIKGISIEKILENENFDCIDVLKLDIEGAEKELFTNNYKSWIDKVNLIIVELHDRFLEGCTDALYNAIERDNWIESKKNDKIILIRKNSVNASSFYK